MKKAVLVSCFDWYDKRLKYIEKYLKHQGYIVDVISSDYDHIKKETILKKENIKYIEVIHYKKNMSIRRILSHYLFAREVSKIVKENDYDLVYALVPPNFVSSKLSRLKNKKNFKLIFDIIDLWPENMPIQKLKNTFPFKYWRNLRNRGLRVADKIVLECDYYRQYLPRDINHKKVNIFYLVKESNIFFDKHASFDGKNVKLAYLGSINSILDIDKIIDVVKILLSKYQVHIKIIGKGSKEKEFINRLESVGARVEFYGSIFDEQKIYNIFKDCHFGLNIYKQTTEIGLTIKSIDYLSYGLPLLNSIKGDTYNLVDKEKIGLNIDNLTLIKINDELEKSEIKQSKVRNVYNKLFDAKHIYQRINYIFNIGNK